MQEGIYRRGCMIFQFIILEFHLNNIDKFVQGFGNNIISMNEGATPEKLVL